MRQELVPTNDDIFAVVDEIVAQGIRRPAYPADQWAEQFCLQRFRDLGLENVRLEPVDVTYWEPRKLVADCVERRGRPVERQGGTLLPSASLRSRSAGLERPDRAFRSAIAGSRQGQRSASSTRR